MNLKDLEKILSCRVISKNMEIQEAAEKILKVSPSVRVVSVCDLNGKLIYSARSKKVNILVSKKQSLGSLKAAAKDWKQRKKLVRSLGPCKYVVAEYDKVKRIVIPAGKNHILYVTTTASLDHNKVLRRVRSFR